MSRVSETLGLMWKATREGRSELRGQREMHMSQAHAPNLAAASTAGGRTWRLSLFAGYIAIVHDSVRPSPCRKTSNRVQAAL